MWTSIIDLSPRRVILTNLLGRFWRGAYFSSFAPLQVQNVPRQSLPGANWVRVRNRLAGVCGSDLHLIHADGDLRIAPAALPTHAQTYLGHEVVGEVIEIGDDVQHLHVGERVVLQHGKNCLSSGVEPLCRSCAAGNYGLCERGILPGLDPIGGGWSEEMLLHEQQLFRVPAAMTDTQAVLLEPSAVAVHTVLRRVPQAGERVLIIGAGTIGLLTLQVVRALSPQAEISVLARYPFQVEKATRMGAAHIIYPQDSYGGVQQATQAQIYTGMLGNRMLLGGYDVIYDTIGTQKTIHNSLRWARAKGTVVLVGLSLHLMHLDLTPVWYQEINLIGTMGQGMETWPLGSHEQRSTFAITTDLITHGLLKPDQLITHHFALNNYRQALMTAMDKRDQRAIKVVFDYSLLPASVVPNVRASARQRKPIATRPIAVAEEEEALQPVQTVLSTSGATWEKQALPVVPQPLATKDESELLNASTLAPVQKASTPLQDIDATQKVRIVEQEQELLEPTESIPVVERPVTIDDTAMEETNIHEVFEQEDSTSSTFDEEATQAVPSVDIKTTLTVPSVGAEVTQAVPSIYEETTLAVPSVNAEVTEAVPSINNEVTQAVPSIYDENTLAVPSIHAHPELAEHEPVSEAPLDELEWLDIIAAEGTQQDAAIVALEQAADMPISTPALLDEQQAQLTESAPVAQILPNELKIQPVEDEPVAYVAQEEQEVQPVEATPIAKSVLDKQEAPPIEDTTITHSVQDEQEVQPVEATPFYTFVDAPYEDTDTPVLEDLQYEREQQSDFRADGFEDINQEDYTSRMNQAEEVVPEEDVAMNSSAEALFPVKTIKATTPAKQRSKNRHKGRNNSGSYRS